MKRVNGSLIFGIIFGVLAVLFFVLGIIGICS